MSLSRRLTHLLFAFAQVVQEPSAMMPGIWLLVSGLRVAHEQNSMRLLQASHMHTARGEAMIIMKYC
jgi:hypothetical protein